MRSTSPDSLHVRFDVDETIFKIPSCDSFLKPEANKNIKKTHARVDKASDF